MNIETCKVINMTTRECIGEYEITTAYNIVLMLNNCCESKYILE